MTRGPFPVARIKYRTRVLPLSTLSLSLPLPLLLRPYSLISLPPLPSPPPQPPCRSRNVFDQPSLLLSPGTHFNPRKPPTTRNPVPIDVPRGEPESLASAIADRFDGVSVDGKSVFIPVGGAEDHFEGCAQGASGLVNMSDFLLDAAGPEEQGASR